MKKLTITFRSGDVFTTVCKNYGVEVSMFTYWTYDDERKGIATTMFYPLDLIASVKVEPA